MSRYRTDALATEPPSALAAAAAPLPSEPHPARCSWRVNTRCQWEVHGPEKRHMVMPLALDRFDFMDSAGDPYPAAPPPSEPLERWKLSVIEDAVAAGVPGARLWRDRIRDDNDAAAPLPSEPLLTPEQRAALDANLRDMAATRRRGNAAARAIPLGGVASLPSDTPADGLDVERWERWTGVVRRHPTLDGVFQRSDFRFVFDIELLARAIRVAELRSQMDAEAMGAVPAENGPLPDWYRAYAVAVAREYAATLDHKERSL